MTGAGRLSSGPQPVTANAAPLCLSLNRRLPTPMRLRFRRSFRQLGNPTPEAATIVTRRAETLRGSGCKRMLVTRA